MRRILACAVLILLVCAGGLHAASEKPPYFYGVNWQMSEGSIAIPVSVQFFDYAYLWDLSCYQTAYYNQEGILVNLPQRRACASTRTGGASENVQTMELIDTFLKSIVNFSDKTYRSGEYVWVLKASTSGEYLECPFALMALIGNETVVDGVGQDAIDQLETNLTGNLEQLQQNITLELDDQNVNKESWWSQLFVPDPVNVEGLVGLLRSFTDLAPINILTEFHDALNNPQTGYFAPENLEGRKVVHFGSFTLPIIGIPIVFDFDVTPFWGGLVWMRRLMGCAVWVVFALAVYRRFVKVVS